MNESEALSRMVAPGTKRPGKYRQGVIQIHVTRACDKSCFGCTQGSNLGGKFTFISPEQFEQACLSLKGYFGVVGLFGGNPATSPHFAELCAILRKHFPREQCGLWCNNPLGKGTVMRETFDPAVSNLNVHLDAEAFAEFKRDWPESQPFGLHQDSRHSPPFVAMKDVIADEGERWDLISRCPINLHWSAMLGVFRGQLRAWFCEIAGAQSILHQDDPDYPDTGTPITLTEEERNHYSLSGSQLWKYRWMSDGVELFPEWFAMRTLGTKFLSWWELPMGAFAPQVRKHCHECSIPLNGYGELAQGETGREQTSATHASIYRPKRKGRNVEAVTELVQLGMGRIERVTEYLQNAKK